MRNFSDGQLEGTFSICAHWVRYRYWGFPDDFEVTDELAEQLEEHAEERAKECLIEGYHSGQLCANIPVYLSDGVVEFEPDGWWEIDS